MNRVHYIFELCLIFLLSWPLVSCQSHSQPPAPLGERQALEKLAKAYDDLSERLPVSPTGLTPEGKLAFVRKVFDRAGYDFTGTLYAFAQLRRDTLNNHHRDMMELLLLPSQGVKESDLAKLYSKAEFASIEKINHLRP